MTRIQTEFIKFLRMIKEFAIMVSPGMTDTDIYNRRDGKEYKITLLEYFQILKAGRISK